MDEWFACSDATPSQEAFLKPLRARAAAWGAYGIGSDDTLVYEYTDPVRLIAAVDVYDPDANLIVGTVRIEFDGAALRGRWGSSHFCDAIDPADPDSIGIERPGITPEEAARLAADWLESQVRRPLERQDWRRDGTTFHRRWVLADSGTVLCWRDEANTQRADLPTPDQVTPLRR